MLRAPFMPNWKFVRREIMNPINSFPDSTAENQLNQQVERGQELQEAFEKQTTSENKDEELQEAVNSFVSLFVQQMFGAMRDTVPEGGIIDGGYAEEVFTDMLDEEISEMGAEQSNFKELNQAVYRQLDRE